MNTIDLAGHTYGRLTVISATERKGYWNCRCECGNHTVAWRKALRNGGKKSCGCLRREIMSKGHMKHGMVGTRIYLRWKSMISRCHCAASTGYKNYGARGVYVCDRWRKSFAAFIEDMGMPPEGMSLDRIDSNGPYCKENCRWADAKTQTRNSRRVKTLTFNGRTLYFQEWAELTGIPRATIHYRLKAGWSIERALTEKVNK